MYLYIMWVFKLNIIIGSLLNILDVLFGEKINFLNVFYKNIFWLEKNINGI